MRIALITSVYGTYDPVRPADAEWGFDDAVLVTDTPVNAEGWRVHVRPSNDSDRLAAKAAKMMPWQFTDCDAAVWVDGSIEITNGAALRATVEPLLERRGLWVWQHPEGRLDARQEAAVCQDWLKYRDGDIRGQVAAYDADGFPANWGLFACGVIAWRFTPESKRFGSLWETECRRWSIQDQISLPYLLWREGFRFGTFPANQYQNPWFRIRWDERPAGQGPSAVS